MLKEFFKKLNFVMIFVKLKHFILILALIIVGCKTIGSEKNVHQIPDIEKKSVKIIPYSLSKGDTIGLVAPGSYITQSQLD